MNRRKSLVLVLMALPSVLTQFVFSQHLECRKKIEMAEIGRAHKLSLWQDRCFILSDDSLYTFTKTGDFLDTIARKGEGPGEFARITDFAVADEGRVIIAGVKAGSKGKIGVFAMDGKLAAEHETDFPIKEVFCSGNNSIYYSTNDVVFHKLKRKSDWGLQGQVSKIKIDNTIDYG